MGLLSPKMEQSECENARVRESEKAQYDNTSGTSGFSDEKMQTLLEPQRHTRDFRFARDGLLCSARLDFPRSV